VCDNPVSAVKSMFVSSPLKSGLGEICLPKPFCWKKFTTWRTFFGTGRGFVEWNQQFHRDVSLIQVVGGVIDRIAAERMAYVHHDDLVLAHILAGDALRGRGPLIRGRARYSPPD